MEELTKTILLEYPLLAPLSFVVLRAIPVIVPPIVGVAVDAVGLFVFGWLYGFLLAEVGILLGATIAFLIARFFREPLATRFVSLEKIHRWESQYSERQKFWTLVLLRFVTSPLFDYISYAAGLTKISTSKFFWSTFIGTLPIMFSIYYFGGLSLQGGPIFAVIFFSALFITWSLAGKQKDAKSIE